MKRSRWGEQGGQAILSFRALVQSNRERAWTLLAHTYKAEVTGELRSYIYNGDDNLQADYRWYVTDGLNELQRFLGELPDGEEVIDF